MERLDFILWMLVAMLIGMLVALFLSLISFQTIPSSILFKMNGYTKDNALNICDDKSLKDTSYCLNAFVNGIFKYNNSYPDSFEELVENGGVCRDYNKLYRELFSKLGFQTRDVSVYWNIGVYEDWGSDENKIYLGDGNIKKGHVYLYAYDKNSNDKIICTLDQTYINCREFG